MKPIEVKTLPEAVERFMHYVRSSKARSTINAYNSYLNNYVLPALSYKRLMHLSEDDVPAVLDRCRSHNLSRATTNTVLAVFRSLLNYSWRCGWLKRQVRVAPVRGQSVRARALGAAEEASILQHADQLAAVGRVAQGFPVALRLMRYAGLRPGEARALRVRDIEYGEDGRPLTVRVSQTDGSPTTKGGRSRDVPLANGLADAVANHIAAAGLGDKDFLAGGDKNAFSRDWRTVVAAAKVNHGAQPKSLRTTFVTDAMRRGANVFAVAAIVGHRNISTTMHYADVDQADRRAVVDLLGRT